VFWTLKECKGFALGNEKKTYNGLTTLSIFSKLHTDSPLNICGSGQSCRISFLGTNLWSNYSKDFAAVL
jgi:hypothetical protein